MLVFFNPDPQDPTSGPVTHTMNEGAENTYGKTNFIVVPDQEFDTLAGLHVSAGVLTTDDQSASYRDSMSRLIDIERDRRMKSGLLFGGTLYDFDDASKSRITGMATLAGFAIGQGAQPGNLHWHGGASPFVWVASDNTFIPMDAQTCFGLGQAAAVHEMTFIFAARALKDAAVIPTDYTNDIHWP